MGIERWLQGWNQAHTDLHAADTVGERGGHFEGLDDFLSAASGITNGSHLLITTRALPAVLDDAAIAMIPVIELGNDIRSRDSVTTVRWRCFAPSASQEK
jgi:hypothetical protein